MMKSLCLASVFAATMAMPVMSQELTEEQVEQATEFALNNSTFVVEHEIGHLFIAEYQFPVLGKEEDAADSLAALLLLQQESEEGNQALINSADGWYLSDTSKKELEEADFYDEHSLDIQRAYQIVCLMVGANPQTFAEVANDFQMDADRQESCGADYETAAGSWDSLLQPHEGKGGNIEVTYEDGGTDYADIEQLLKDSGFLERAAASITDKYELPRDLSFVGKACGEENAFYSYEEGGITFCYEMVALFFNLIETEMKASKT